jgi:hypothetical protein
VTLPLFGGRRSKPVGGVMQGRDARMRERAVVGAFVLLLLVLAGTSAPRIVGDGDEYLRAADRIGHFHAPGGVSRHFWLYPALAAPLVRLAEAVGIDPLTGFTLLNVLLLTAAFAIVLRRVGLPGTALLMVGPVIWWLDKPHTEPFTFSLLAIGFASLPAAPWWTFVAVATAGTHNLPIALALPPLGLAAVAMRPAWVRDLRWWAGLAAAAAVLAGALGYNLMHAGRVAPLLGREHLALPSMAEIGAPLWDPNLGLLPNFPGFTIVVAGLVLVFLLTARRALLAPDILAAAVSAAAFVFGAAQANNVNHGGTPGMSRYAVWLIPASIPLLARAREALQPSAKRWMIAVTAASAVASLVVYHPRAAERTGEPTPLARFLWTHYPSLDNPLPEVFVERINGLDEDWAPTSTEGCEKILLGGRGAGRPIWPMPCPTASPPAECFEPARSCYANRTATGYRFVVFPPRDDRLRVRREDIWTPAAERVTAEVFAGLDWHELRRATMIVSSHDVARVAGIQTVRGTIVSLRGIGPGASLVLTLPAPGSSRFVRADTGDTVADVRIASGVSHVAVPRSQDAASLLFIVPTPGR